MKYIVYSRLSHNHLYFYKRATWTENMTEEKNGEEEDVYREIAERDKLIHDIIRDRHSLEWDRFKILDVKAGGVITSVGIILVLQGGIVASIIRNAPINNILFIPIMSLFVFGILYLTLSILCSLYAYFIKDWIVPPKADYLIEEGWKEERSRIHVIRTMSQVMANSIKMNFINNKEKKRFIEYGFIFLAAGLIVNMISIACLIIMIAKG